MLCSPVSRCVSISFVHLKVLLFTASVYIFIVFAAKGNLWFVSAKCPKCFFKMSETLSEMRIKASENFSSEI